MQIKITRLSTIALISLSTILLGGCSAGMIQPQKGSPNMADVYAASQAGQTTYFQGQDNHHTQTSVAGFSLPKHQASQSTGVISTINSQFPTLPNPQSLMYIFGHYAGAQQLPVPGHYTAFPLYNETHYALPNEVLMPYNDGQFN